MSAGGESIITRGLTAAQKDTLLVAGAFAGMAVLLSVKLIWQHYSAFSNPSHQRKIVAILWMVPIYAVDSWLSLRFKSWAVYFDMVRDIYEAYVIYLFFALMVAYLGDGDEYKVVRLLESLPPLRHPPPLGCLLKRIPLGLPFLRSCKKGILAFVVLKPFCTVLAIILEAAGVYDAGNFTPNRGYLWVSIVLNAAISYAFYYLLLFYLALHRHLAPFNPVPKFLVIKFILFMSFWQSIIMAALGHLTIMQEARKLTIEPVTTGIQNVLVCFEMFLVACAHQFAFPAAEYRKGDSMPSTTVKDVLSDQLALSDAVRDFNEVSPSVLLPSGFQPSVVGVEYSVGPDDAASSRRDASSLSDTPSIGGSSVLPASAGHAASGSDGSQIMIDHDSDSDSYAGSDDDDDDAYHAAAGGHHAGRDSHVMSLGEADESAPLVGSVWGEA